MWDVTAAAPVHAALAGVLAGIAFVLIGIVATDRSSGGSPPQPQGGSSAPSNANHLRLLFQSVFLLIVAAVQWGGLAGQPDREAVRQLGAAQELVASRNLALGGAAVMILSIGALSMIGGMVHLATLAPPNSSAELQGLLAWAFPLLGALAVYEVAFYCFAATRWSGADEYGNRLALSALVLTAVFSAPASAGPFKWMRRVRRAIWQSSLKLSRAHSAGGLLTRSAAMVAIASVVAYAISPASGTALGADVISSSATPTALDAAVAAILWLGLLLSAVFVVLLSEFLAHFEEGAQ